MAIAFIHSLLIIWSSIWKSIVLDKDFLVKPEHIGT